MSWIQDKTRVLEDTEELTGDLTGVMKLQRRLSMMERDLGAIQAKLDTLREPFDRAPEPEIEACERILRRVRLLAKTRKRARV